MARDARFWALVLICVFAGLTFTATARASCEPPAEGDWIIEAGEECTLDGQDLTVPGGLYINGTLTLTNCTLRFSPSDWFEDPLWIEGRLDATNTSLTTTSEVPVYVTTRGSSVNTFTGCTFTNAYASFGESSQNTITDCSFGNGYLANFSGDSSNSIINAEFLAVKVTFAGNSDNYADGCKFAPASWSGTGGTSHNTFSGCTFSGDDVFHFCSSSYSVVAGCTFAEGVPTVLQLEGDAILPIDGAAPGYQDGTIIQSSNNPFRLELLDTTVNAFVVRAYDVSSLSIDASQIETLQCSNRGLTELADSYVGMLSVTNFNAFHDPYPPISLTVDGFQDGPSRQNVEIGTDDLLLPVLISLNNTTVTGSLWEFADGGDSSTPTDNVIRNSIISGATVAQDSSLLVANTEFTSGGAGAGVGPEGDTDATAQLTLEDCPLVTQLALYGAATTATVRRSTLSGKLVFGHSWMHSYWETAPWAPTLVLESASFIPGYDSQVYVDPDVIAASVLGTVAMDPSYAVAEWWPGSTIMRSFPVQVVGPDEQPLAGVMVCVLDPEENPIWCGPTGADGYAYPEVTFDDSNYDTEYRVTASAGGESDSAPLSFLSSTPIVLSVGTHRISFTSFEEERYPWTVFAAGPDEAATWRQVGGSATWREGLIAPPAHSGEHTMLADVGGEGITGLRLDLPVTLTGPVEYTLRSWVHVDDRTPADSSAFVGFVFSEDYPSSAVGWAGALGWEVFSAGSSRWQLAGSSEAMAEGLAESAWHLVELKYAVATNRLVLRVDGMLVGEREVPATGQLPRHAVLGALGQSVSARQRVCFDDASLRLMAILGSPSQAQLFAAMRGSELVAESTQYSYIIRYGNGYPLLGTEPLEGEPPEQMYVGLSLPEGYSFVHATPEPTSVAGETLVTLVWERPIPAFGQEGSLYVVAETPAAPSGAVTKMLYLWATDNAAAASSVPPNPPDWSSPCDATWACPRDLLPQLIIPEADLLPDVWVSKEGPRFASPGDTINYVITVGNCGPVSVGDIVVRDQLPGDLGGEDLTVAYLAGLDPGETWRGLVSEELPWGVEGGTPLLNLAYVPTAPAEVVTGNNEALWESTVLAAHDPNRISVAPEGTVSRGETLTYTIECENTGAGTAYGVHATALLDHSLDDETLVLPSGVAYDPTSRALVWEVGTLPSGAGASTSLAVQVAEGAPIEDPIIGQAVIYFPSVPEETPTNIVVTRLLRSFWDVGSDYWAFSEIQAVCAGDIAYGYPDGYYRPDSTVTRDQMAVYISRALAGGDDGIPEGPEEPAFPDVPVDHWAYKYVEYAVAADVVAGYADGSYHPEWAVTRAQMAVYIARAKDYELVAPEADLFPDVPVGFWADEEIKACVDHDVARGYPDGYYRPTRVVTRAQMAVFITRAFELPM